MSNDRKKIVILGGVGEVGSAVTKDLAQCPELGEIVIADIEIDQAKTLAASLGNNVSAVELDLGDRDGAVRLLKDANMLMNCTSLVMFDRVIGLAVEAGVDYADLISEPTPEQRRMVKEAGITAISGLGLSPGVSNVLVRHAADAFDEIEEAHINGLSWRAMAPSPGGLDTILWENADDCPTRQYYQNGRFHRAGPFEGTRVVEFPEPVGPHRVYFVPHTETTSLVRNFPTLKFCAARVSWREELSEDIRVLNKYGLLDHTPLPDNPGISAFDATRAQIWKKMGGKRYADAHALYINVEVIGVRGNQSFKRVYNVSHPSDWGARSVGNMTGVCAAVGAQLLARQGRTHIGFVDPEVYYDPNEMLEELKGRGTVFVNWEETPADGEELLRR